MKTATALFAAFAFAAVLVSGSVFAAEKTLTPQQERMKACNADPKAKELKGDERKAFMSSCLKGNSTAAAVTSVKAAGATSVRLIAIIAAPEGIERIHREHPDVSIVVASVDRGLNDKGYIVPGLGDAGDRLYGTK